jgi:phage baseplate assembly protein W
MKLPSYRAVEFLLPSSQGGGYGHGLQVGLHSELGMVEEAASVRQAILLLLSTAPGERVMRPGYGCDLRRLLFMQNDNTTAGLAIHTVRQALLRWEPRIEIEHIDAGPDPDDPARLDIYLEYRLRQSQEKQQLQYSIDLAGA